MKALWAALAVALIGVGQPAAAQSSAVNEHYRAYLAAMERGDVAAAGAAAELAWQAAERQDGTSARTAVLAFNLASLRVEAGDRTGALEPARRAASLAASLGPEAGLDPGDANSVLGIAELAAKVPGAEDRLLNVLRAAPVELGADPSWRHRAAFALAPALVALSRYPEAAEVYAVAFRTADAADPNRDYFRGLARTGQGAALSMANRDQEAVTTLEEAIRLLVAFAPETLGDGESRGLRAYVQARAWLAATLAKGQYRLSAPLPERRALDGAAPLCRMRFEPRPMPRYPRSAESDLKVGSVIVRLKTDAQGRVVRATYAARVPETGFADAVPLDRISWRASMLPGSAPNCRRQSDDLLQVITFRLE